MIWAVRRLSNCSIAEEKIGVPRVIMWPTTSRAERENFLRGGQAGVGASWRRRWLDGGSGQPRFGVAGDLDGGKGGGCLGGHRRPLEGWLRASAAIDDKAGGPLDIGKRHPPHGYEAEKDGNADWDLAITASPPSKVPLADVKYLGGAALCDAEGGEFGGGRGARASLPEAKYAVKFCRG